MRCEPEVCHWCRVSIACICSLAGRIFKNSNWCNSEELYNLHGYQRVPGSLVQLQTFKFRPQFADLASNVVRGRRFIRVCRSLLWKSSTFPSPSGTVRGPTFWYICRCVASIRCTSIYLHCELEFVYRVVSPPITVGRQRIDLLNNAGIERQFESLGWIIFYNYNILDVYAGSQAQGSWS